MVKGAAIGKFAQPFDVVVLKGIGANSLVCIGVILGTIARSDLGKVVLIWIPIATFATIGTKSTTIHLMAFCFSLMLNNLKIDIIL